MARIAGINLPANKHTRIALTYIFGIGHTRAGLICERAGIEPARKLRELSEEELDRLRAEAVEWSVTRGSRSGRVAWQFIQDLAGRLGQPLR